MPNYQNGKIYKIVNYENDDVYIGSTCEPTLARRLSNHVANYRGYLNGKRGYTTSFKIIETGNYDIQLIEAYPCNNKMELHAREGYWIKQMDCVNRRIAGRTIQEYREDNREALKEYRKTYNKINKKEITKVRKVYCINNKEIVAKAMKTYRDKNKEKIRERMKKYREDNKEKFAEIRNEKHDCLCGGKFTIANKALHFKTSKHQSYINSIDFLQDIHKMVISIINKYK
jgi:hypothetical protein